MGEDSPFSGMELVGGEGKEGANVDIFSTSIGITDRRVTVFGMDPVELKAMLKERFGELKDLSAEKLEGVHRYEVLNERYLRLKEQAASGAAKACEKLESEMSSIEEEMKGLYGELEAESPE